MHCVVSKGLVLGQLWTAGYQQYWYWDRGQLYDISRTGTAALGDYVILVGLVLRQ